MSPTLDHAASSALDGTTPEQNEWLTMSGLSIVVVGASGDLAKKKTYPSLLNLYEDSLLPENTIIWVYARSKMTDDGLLDRIRPYLEKGNTPKDVIENFLSICRYVGGTS